MYVGVDAGASQSSCKEAAEWSLTDPERLGTCCLIHGATDPFDFRSVGEDLARKGWDCLLDEVNQRK